MPIVRKREQRRARFVWLFAAASEIMHGELLLPMWLAMKWGAA